MNESTLILIAAGMVALFALWAFYGEQVQLVYKDWKNRKEGKSVFFKFTVNGKVKYFGECLATETEPLGTVHLLPEYQFREHVITPARYVKSPEAMRRPPIRVKQNSVCMLEIRNLNDR